MCTVKLYHNMPHYNTLQHLNCVCLVLMMIGAKVSKLFKKNLPMRLCA